MTDVDRLLRKAIAEKRLIQFVLHGRVRIAEPHDYGVRKGVPQLLAYQVAGESQSGGLPQWRWVKLSEASDFVLLDATFAGSRGAESRDHSVWDEVYARVG